MTTETSPHAGETSNPVARPGFRGLTCAARILLGLVFFVFGLNGFFHFIPQPKTPMSEGAMSLAGALMGTDYMHHLIFGTQALVGALLLANRFVPLALALIAPVIVNIIAFHLFLAPSGIPVAAIVVVLEAYLAWAYRESFRPMVAWRASPRASRTSQAQGVPQDHGGVGSLSPGLR